MVSPLDSQPLPALPPPSEEQKVSTLRAPNCQKRTLCCNPGMVVPLLQKVTRKYAHGGKGGSKSKELLPFQQWVEML